MNYVLMGPVGSGKSTQAKLLAQNLNCPHLNTGDLLYFASLDPAEQGALIKGYMSKGEMVPAEITEHLLVEYLKDHQDYKNLVIDGFPRTFEEAKNSHILVDKVFYIQIPDEVAKERLAKRERADDTPGLIEKRLKTYHEETEPILNMYETSGMLEKINGDRTIEEVAQDIVSRINK